MRASSREDEMHWHTGLLTAAFVCAAGVAYAVESAGPFMGGWVVTESKPAPWSTATDPPNAALIDAKLSFHRNSVDGPAPLGCAKATFWSEPSPPANLFAGNLTEPQKQARDLGFGSRIVILSVSCKSAETPVPDFALVDERTAMFALGGHIYIMKR
jgi:hypothetical protein